MRSKSEKSLLERVYSGEKEYSHLFYDDVFSRKAFEEEYSEFIENKCNGECLSKPFIQIQCKCLIYLNGYNWSIKLSKAKNYDKYLQHLSEVCFGVNLIRNTLDDNQLFKVSQNLYKFISNISDKDFNKLLSIISSKKDTDNLFLASCDYISVTGKTLENKEFVSSIYLGYDDVDDENNKDCIHMKMYLYFENSLKTYGDMFFNLKTKQFGTVKRCGARKSNGLFDIELLPLNQNMDLDFYNIFKTILFLRFIEVETKYTYITPRTKSTFNNSQGLVKPKSFKIINADINYNFNLVSTGDFKVTSHFRLQPYGTKKDKHKLIFIDEFIKHGYNKKATAVR